MKLILFFLAFFTFGPVHADVLAHKIAHIKGEAKSLEDYLAKGPVLIVNIATQCGYTGQLDDLEKLYQRYKEKGLTILGIPSNDFGSQTPEDNEAVAKFCRLNYGVSFPLSTKQKVKGDDQHQLYKWLTSKDFGKGGEVKWNFEKFLISGKKKPVKRFRSDIKPLSKEVTSAIEGILGK